MMKHQMTPFVLKTTRVKRQDWTTIILRMKEIGQNPHSWSQDFKREKKKGLKHLSLKKKKSCTRYFLLPAMDPDFILYNFSLISSCMLGKNTPKHISSVVEPLKRDASLLNRANGNAACYISQTLLFHVGWGVCGNLIRLHYLKSRWSKLISHLPSVWDHLHLALEWRLELFPHLSCCHFPCLFCFSSAATRLIACSGARRQEHVLLISEGAKDTG